MTLWSQEVSAVSPSDWKNRNVRLSPPSANQLLVYSSHLQSRGYCRRPASLSQCETLLRTNHGFHEEVTEKEHHCEYGRRFCIGREKWHYFFFYVKHKFRRFIECKLWLKYFYYRKVHLKAKKCVSSLVFAVPSSRGASAQFLHETSPNECCGLSSSRATISSFSSVFLGTLSTLSEVSCSKTSLQLMSLTTTIWWWTELQEVEKRLALGLCDCNLVSLYCELILTINTLKNYSNETQMVLDTTFRIIYWVLLEIMTGE